MSGPETEALEALRELRDAAQSFRGNKPYRESDPTEQPLLDALMAADALLSAPSPVREPAAPNAHILDGMVFRDPGRPVREPEGLADALHTLHTTFPFSTSASDVACGWGWFEPGEPSDCAHFAAAIAARLAATPERPADEVDG